MARYRIIKVSKFNEEVKYIIQKKGLLGWEQAYYDDAPWTFKAVTDNMNEALELLATKFNVPKAWEVMFEGKSVHN